MEQETTDDFARVLTDEGFEITSGYRTQKDQVRLLREGYHPAANSEHLEGNAVDVVPKNGDKDAAIKRLMDLVGDWDGAVILDEGDHIHLQLPGWHGAPGTPGLAPKPTAPPTSTDYSEMTGDRTARTVVAPGSTTRTVDDPDAEATIDSLVRQSVPYGDALKQVRDKFPEYPGFAPGEYNAAVKYHADHPDYKGSFAAVTKSVPLTEQEQAANDVAQSGAGALAGHFANSLAAGAPVAAAGETGNYYEDLSAQEHPVLSTIGDLAGTVAGAVLGGKAIGTGARALAEGEGALAIPAGWVVEHPGITQSGVDLAMGAGYGAAAAGPGHRTEGAAFGAATTAGLEGLGRLLLAPAVKAGAGAVRDAVEGRAARNMAEDAVGAPLERDTVGEAVGQPEASIDERAQRVGVRQQPGEDDATFLTRIESVEAAGRDLMARQENAAPPLFSNTAAHGGGPSSEALMRTEGGPSVFSEPVGELRIAPGTPEQRAAAAEVQPENVLPSDIAPSEPRPISEVAKAGNINLSRIETPEDIDALMKFTTDTFDGFKGERRGVQKWDQTQKLAEDLGMSPEELLSRRTGEAYNAEQALAARNVLAASASETRQLAGAAVNGSEEAKGAFIKSFLLHAAITEKAAGAAAEAGRALNIYNKVAKAGLGDRQAMQDAIKRLQDGATVEDVAAMVNSLADDPSALNRFARDAIKPSLKDKLLFVWINSLLSGPKTHIVNITSNLVTAAMDIPETALAAGIGTVRKALGGKGDQILASELGPRFYGMVRGGAEGLAAAKEGFTKEAGGKIDAPRPAIGGRAGDIISLPTRLLNSEDEFFKAMARRSELAGLAVRKANSEGLKGSALRARADELMANPTGEMMSAAADAALYKTYQRPLGPAMQSVSNALQKAPVLRLFIPFIRTPTNLLKYAIERSPAAPLLKEVRTEFMAGGAKRDVAIARMVMGTGLGAIVAGLATQGKITGNGPADPSAKRALEANGWQPYSLRVGNEWVSYRRLDPWATVIGTAADAVELQSAMTDKQAQDAGAVLVGAMTQNLASKTWLSGLSDLIDAVTDPQANAKNTLTRLATSIATPTLASQITQMTDPVMRDTLDPSYMGQIRKKIEARLPGLSTNVIPRRDILGHEVRDEGGPLDRLISPFDTRKVRNDPVAKAIYDSGARFSVPSRNVGGGRLPDDAFDAYQQVAAQKFYDAMKETLASPDWETTPREARGKLIEKVKNNSRKDARAELFGLDH